MSKHQEYIDLANRTGLRIVRWHDTETGMMLAARCKYMSSYVDMQGCECWVYEHDKASGAEWAIVLRHPSQPQAARYR